MSALLHMRAQLLRRFWAAPTPTLALEISWVCAILSALDGRRAAGWRKVGEAYLEQAKTLRGEGGKDEV